MAGEAASGSGVTSPTSWLIDHVSAMLEPAEREVVRGDFEECGIRGGRALRGLLGLIARRQAQLWTDWQPWLALVFLVVPIGMILSVVSRNWAVGGALYGWLYGNNWTWGYVASPGARLDLARIVGSFGVSYLALAGWAWTTGFALGSLSRRAVWINGALFSLVVFGGTLGTTTTGLQNPFNAAVFSLAFYRVAFPVLVRAVLIMLPALWGMQNGVRLTVLTVRQAKVWPPTLTPCARHQLVFPGGQHRVTEIVELRLRQGWDLGQPLKLRGALSTSCQLSPIQYRAFVLAAEST